MTREEAINYLKNSMAIGEDDDSRYHNEVLDFIIKVLKQEPCVTMRDLSEEELKHFAEEMKKVRVQVVKQESVLDKIRAEIMAIGNWSTKSELPNGYLVKVLEIIDKYKAESEEQKYGINR